MSISADGIAPPPMSGEAEERVNRGGGFRREHQCTSSCRDGGKDLGVMTTVTERELLLFIKSRVLRQLDVIQMGGGRFQLRASITVAPGGLVLCGSRNKPREWASLDTLVRHICTKYGAPCPIALSLRGEAARIARKNCRGGAHAVAD